MSSERRGSSARRGMTVLGKIPAVPKPINLPSQRLENRGLDPNVEIVPRGSVSWGSAGRSPPTSVNAWGTPSQASSPPSSSGAWGPKAGAASVGGNSSISGGSTLGGPGNIPRPSSGGSGARPSSGGTRPLSAESIGQPQQSPDSFSSNANSSSAWGARPSSASGVLGQAQPQLAQAQAQARPRSADISRPNRSLSEFGDQSGSHSPPGNAAWGNRGPPRRLGEEPHQVSRFQLTRTDFPTLGSEKNPDLRPQHSNSAADRGASVETKGAHPEERRPPTPPGPHEEILPMPPSGGYGHPDRGAPDNWRREPAAFQGPPPAAEGNWHRDGPSARPSYGGQGPQPDSWRREAAPSGGPADDNWRRGGAPPVGQYGPPPGAGHYPHEGPGFMHQPRFGPGPAPFGRGAPGPGGYGHHGDMYGNAGPLLRPAGPMHPMRPNMFQGPVPYDGFYGPPGPGYQGMEDPERMMMGMGGGPYGGFPGHRGPPPEAFGRFPHGGMSQGPRHPPNSSLRERERGEAVGDGYHEGQNYHKEGSEGPGHKDGRGYNDRYIGGPGPGQEAGDNRRGGLHRAAPTGADAHGQGQRGTSGGHHGGHRDWGAAASSDEPMDFSKPVFEEEVMSASPSASGKQSPSSAQKDETSAEEVKREDVKVDVNTEKNVVEVETVKDEEKKVVVATKSDTAAPHRSAEVSSAPKSKIEGGDVSEGKDQAERKMQNVVDKEVVAKIVTKDGPGKWERGSKRADSHTREVIGPAASGAPTANLRSGQYSSGGPSKSSSILGNAPRNAAAPDVAPAPQILQHPSQEKPSAVSAPPASEVEVPKAVEKGRILRRPESPKVESGSIETGASDVSATQTAAAHEGSGKEGLKPKGKASSHDGEKEWRPKVPIAEASPRPSVAAVPQVSEPTVAPATSGTEPTEDNTTDSETGPKPGSYDYDAQRAKMKEIAAQRARQLQKEEEERIKEQKAKARAKLEELDRRSTVVPLPTAEEPTVEVPKTTAEVEEAQQPEEIPAVEAEPALQSGSSTGSTKRAVRNEHGKRERDKKANGRKAGVGEGAKAKVNGAPGQASAILPPLIATAAPLLTTPMPVPEVYGQHANSQREPRHRGRPEKKQLVVKGEDGDRSVPTALDIPPPAANGGWSMDSPLPPQETDSANTSHLTTSGTEGSGSLRKSKNGRNSRNRPRAEAPPMMAESIQFGDLVSGLHIPAFHTSVGGEQPVDPAVSAFHIDVGKDSNSLSNVSLSGDALTGDEGSAVSTNGDASSKRMQRKSRSARRGPARSDRGSQDQRTAEKSHASDSMVWAPVRSPGAGGGNKGEVPHFNEQQKEESSSAQQQARAKRAEMERYTPKPLMKYQEASDQPAAPPAHQHTQGAQNQSSQGVVPAPATAAEFPRGGSVAENKQVSSADPKSNHDTKPIDSGAKAGRSHGSWRQRGSGSDRAGDSAKDAPAAVNSTGAAHGESGHPRHRSEQKSAGGQAPSRRNQPVSDHLLATPQITPVAPPPAPAAAAAALPAAPGPAPSPAPSPAPASVQVAEREHPADKKLYQPPRPASAPAHRGQDHRVQDHRGQDNRGQDHRGQDYRGQDHRGHDHRGQDHRGQDHRGQDHRGQDHRGQDHRGQDHRGHDHRGQDHRGQGPHASDQKGHEQGTAPHSRHSNAPSDRPLSSEYSGSQQHHRNGGGHHPRGQNADKEQAPSQPAYMAPHSQQKPHPTASTKERSHPVTREGESQQQQSSRGSSQHSAETGDHGSNHRGRFERDQAARPSSGSQRGQSHWQQTGGNEGFRAAPSRPHPAERDLPATAQYGRMEVSKQQAPDSQRPHQVEQAGQQQNKAPQQTAPVAIPSPKVDSGNWEGAGGSPPVMRGRDFNHGGRRGRFGGRSGPRNTEMEHRRDPPSTKQRLVIDATGGAVPSQVGG